MRFAGNVAAQTLDHLTEFIRKGVTTESINDEAEAFIRKHGCTPAFKGYLGYTHAVCASVNGQVVHCKPTQDKLKNGDIVTIDLGAKYEEFNSDTAKTFLIGDVEPRIKRFVEVGYEALMEAIKKAVVGNHVSDISNTVYTIITKNRYGAVREFMGHGIGKIVHEEPQIPNTHLENGGPELKAGMVICIEPILTLNPSGKVKMKDPKDRWSVLTLDGCVATHAEHMVSITNDGPEILTLRKDEKPI